MQGSTSQWAGPSEITNKKSAAYAALSILKNKIINN